MDIQNDMCAKIPYKITMWAIWVQTGALRIFPLAGDDDDAGQRYLDQDVDLDDHDNDDGGHSDRHLGTNWGSVALHLGSSHLAVNSFFSTSNLWMLPHCREVVVMIMVIVQGGYDHFHDDFHDDINFSTSNLWILPHCREVVDIIMVLVVMVVMVIMIIF